MVCSQDRKKKSIIHYQGLPAFMKKTLIALALCAAPHFAAAQVQLKLDAGDLPVQRNAILKAIDTKEYSELSSKEREELLGLLQSVDGAAAASGAPADAERRVNEILSRAYTDSKLYCRQIKEVGSNMSKRSCMTMGAKRRAAESREAAQSIKVY